MLLWLLAFSPRSLTCQVGAADQDQADELRKAAKDIVRLNPWMGEFVEVQASCIVGALTDGRCDIIAADVAGSHGARPDLLILNELSHVTKEEFASNLLDNASKVPHGVVIIATNAGFTDSWQWKLRELARTSDRWHFSAYTQPAPWLDPAELAEARRRNSPQRYARLWEGAWVSGTGDALAEDDIAAAITAAGPMTGCEHGWVFYGGLDLGISRDHAALVVVAAHVGHVELSREQPPPETIAVAAMRDAGILPPPPPPKSTIHHGTGRLRLAHAVSFAPTATRKVDLQSVEKAVIAVHRQFNLRLLSYDPYEARLLAQRAIQVGVPMEEVTFSGVNLVAMASSLLEAFTSRQLELYNHPGLLADLRRARLVERSYGMRLESPRGVHGHGDLATGFMLALLAARRRPALMATIDRPLLLHPLPDDLDDERKQWFER
jgi:phage terminase large subunit-like protein